jgi:hypothetical protein
MNGRNMRFNNIDRNDESRLRDILTGLYFIGSESTILAAIIALAICLLSRVSVQRWCLNTRLWVFDILEHFLQRGVLGLSCHHGRLVKHVTFSSSNFGHGGLLAGVRYRVGGPLL